MTIWDMIAINIHLIMCLVIMTLLLEVFKYKPPVKKAKHADVNENVKNHRIFKKYF